MQLFSRKRAESWASVREEVDKVIRSVAAGTGTAVNVGELVFLLTRDITYRAAFGASSMDGQDEFISILQEFSRLFGAFNVADFIPYLGWIDPQRINDRVVAARKSLDGFIDNIIDDHMRKEKKNQKDDVDTDMVDELLAFYGEGEAKVTESDDLQSSIKLTRDNIKAIIMVSMNEIIKEKQNHLLTRKVIWYSDMRYYYQIILFYLLKFIIYNFFKYNFSLILSHLDFTSPLSFKAFFISSKLSAI